MKKKPRRPLFPPPVKQRFPFKPHPLGPWGEVRDQIHLADLAFRRIERKLAHRHGLSATEARLLVWAYQHHGSTGSNVARALHLSAARVSQVMERLESRRLVWRRARGEGGRVAGIYPTNLGQVLAVEVGRDLQAALERVVGPLGEPGMLALAGACGRLAHGAAHEGGPRRDARDDDDEPAVPPSS